MKILYISNSRFPTKKAHGIQIVHMCQAFAEQGIDLELILPTRKNKQFKDVNPFEYYLVKQNFKIRKIKSFDPSFLIKFPSGVYIKFQALFFMLSLFFYLLFKKNKAEYIFYTRDEYLLPLLQLFSKKVVWEAHTLPRNKNKYLKYWQRCFKIITISQSLKNALVGIGINENKILIAHDAVELEKFNLSQDKKSIRQKLGLSLDKKIITYAGHLYEWKGAQVLANAANYLTDDDLVVFIGGTDVDLKQFEQKNFNLIDQNKILLVGHKEQSQIPYYLKAADILVIPNSAKFKKSYWTSPLKLFEYMAAGVPIIAADLPTIREILNNESAIFFQPDNSQDLAKKIQLILQDKVLSDKISQQALLDVQQYTWQKRAERILKFMGH